ncbi:MAG TPA: glycosyl hydrolase [Prolixibacteraceae bacterium]|nr:glycosyl hydrolase [Prolixibacteraceae bacterium]
MMKNSRNLLLSGIVLAALMLPVSPCQSQQKESKSEWPEITKESKPWSRWWWMGSAVDEVNLTDLISRYGNAGFGGLEITPIYGAVGYESTYLPFLSPGWMKMLDVSVREARKNNMGIDMNTGTGWPFGGPQITRQAAAAKLILQKYSVPKGERLAEKLIPSDPRQVEGGAHLQAVTAYSADGKVVDLTHLADDGGTLQWKAENSDWEIYAAFCGKTLQKVKRAAPGGEGLTFDHFSKEALTLYLTRFDSAFHQDNHGVRAFFNDSYEVYGTNWSESIFDEFQKRRGYSLKSHLRELAEKKPLTDLSRRVQSDYRETLSDMLLENFTRTWTGWANGKGSLTKNQAHGSPGNLLDLYAAVDVPECETFGSSKFEIPGLRRDSADIRNVDPDPAMMKFASSASHVSGKKLTSCETFTWLAEHFRVSLSQCKPEVEQAFLAGVNHVFYHGTAYSPAEAGWPGWLFYASVNFAPSNSFWPHVNGLNEYIARCQTILQSGVAHNDLLVYWPVYDVWNMPESTDLLLTIHSIDKWLYPTPFCKDVKTLMQTGYSLDYVSDKLLNGLSVKDGLITAGSGSTYRTLVVPATQYMPVSTLRRIMEMANLGAEVIFERLPEDVPGMTNLEDNRLKMKELLSSIQFNSISDNIKSAKIGEGEIVQSNQVRDALEWKNIRRETLNDTGIKYIRRKSDKGVYYYLVNHSAVPFDGYLPLNENGKSCLLLDPQSGLTGLARMVTLKEQTKVRLQLNPGQAMFVMVSGNRLDIQQWKYLSELQRQIPVTGPWELEFTSGGATIPAKTELKALVSWPELPDPNAKNYSGSARYRTNIEIKGNLKGEFILDLGKVCESARVWVNGKDAGILWSIPFTANISGFLKQGINTIEIEVANLMANRIMQMDQQKIPWRNYHEINFVNIDYKPFDASAWKPMPSGLLGPVTITQWKVN